MSRLKIKNRGVDEVEVDMDLRKIIIRDYALEERKVFKAIKHAGKAAEPWPYPAYSHFSSFYKYLIRSINHYYDIII
ncbi:hypothetical protein CDL12_09061 [Handroanthus impetiginosus]|uniref:Uncharacterized protein n=1 Tax=Handroanthus impetiginosus TaxID=429701 RepID=A0A2G9HL76_9LAMI|nr:hypothetical protein CDL12_09061 [Handroanthus impetiginosus]